MIEIDESKIEAFMLLKARYAVMVNCVLGNGGNLHGVNKRETEKRRAKNRIARKARGEKA